MNTATPASTLDREVEGRLKSNQIRYTRGRRRVVAVLSASDGPMSATELHAEIGSAVPLSSLYRSLSVLAGSGVLDHHFSAGGVTRYELAEWLNGHHHHLICLLCGKVEDLELPSAVEEQVEHLVARIGREASFSPTDHALEIEGRCTQCR
ncbi:MAG: Fur family transcriptional regulator [Acidimicrobiia bacterium]|nr:Fur family transcriptional regulator [Acidimicrobiia bacterium]